MTPLFLLVLTTGYVLGMELTPPGPTFRDVAELERLDEPTGIMVVENGLYVVSYMINASVWSIGFLFAGVVEYAVRTTWEWPPSIPASPQWLSISGGFEWVLYAFGAVGMWILAAVPLYLLLGHRLIAPAALLTVFSISPLAAGIEYGLRRIDGASSSVS